MGRPANQRVGRVGQTVMNIVAGQCDFRIAEHGRQYVLHHLSGIDHNSTEPFVSIFIPETGNPIRTHSPVDGARDGRVLQRCLAQFQACRVRWHVPILARAAQQNVLKVVHRAALAQAIEEALPQIRRVPEAQLLQRP